MVRRGGVYGDWEGLAMKRWMVVLAAMAFGGPSASAQEVLVADVDGDGAWTVFDFLAFLNVFEDGC
jgi:hypothetical protein